MEGLQYFRIGNDMDTGGRRAVTTLAVEDTFAQSSLTRNGEWMGPALHVEVSGSWVPDWNLLAGSSVPLVSRRTGEIIAALAKPAIQRIPVELPGVEGSWEVLGIRMIDCADGNQADPLQALFPVIDLDRAMDATVFRLPGLTVIVRQEVRDAFRKHQVTGARFVPVTAR